MKSKSRSEKKKIPAIPEEPKKEIPFTKEITSQIRCLIGFVILTAPSLLVKSVFKNGSEKEERISNLIYTYIACIRTAILMVLNIFETFLRHFISFPLIFSILEYIKEKIGNFEKSGIKIKRESDFEKKSEEIDYLDHLVPESPKFKIYIWNLLLFFYDKITSLFSWFFVVISRRFEKFCQRIFPFKSEYCRNLYVEFKAKVESEEFLDSRELVNVIARNFLFAVYVVYAMALMIFFEIYKIAKNFMARFLRLESDPRIFIVTNEDVTESSDIPQTQNVKICQIRKVQDENICPLVKDFSSCSDEEVISTVEKIKEESHSQEEKIKIL